jgi:hypothetical protein
MAASWQTSSASGTRRAARELFDDNRRRVLQNGYDCFVPYALGVAAAMAATDGDHARAARLLGVTGSAFRELGQVPAPDDATELDAVRTHVDALGPAAFEELYAHGSTLDVREAPADPGSLPGVVRSGSTGAAGPRSDCRWDSVPSRHVPTGRPSHRARP